MKGQTICLVPYSDSESDDDNVQVMTDSDDEVQIISDIEGDVQIIQEEIPIVNIHQKRFKCEVRNNYLAAAV